LLVTCETDDARAALAQIGVDASSVSPEARLTPLRTVTVPGTIPCHVSLHPTGQWAACACYGSGDVLVYRTDATGCPSVLAFQTRHTGSSAHPVRQTMPHPHATCFSPDGRWLLVPDLGTDEIWCHPFNERDGSLGPPKRFPVPPGSGPRLLLFAPDGRHAIAVFELSSAVAVLHWDNGELACRRTMPSTIALHAGTLQAGVNTAAGLRWHPSGRYFAVSNRGIDTIVSFRYNGIAGEISPVSDVPAGGAKPRDFEFSPCGRWLIAAAQDGNVLAVIAVDPTTGALHPTDIRHAMHSPSCVRFLPAASE
jgi:6-phosphogluconolactonase